MRSSISMSDIALGLTICIYVTLYCSSCVVCVENERGAQDMMQSNGGSSTNSREDLLPVKRGGNERYFRNYYEMLRDSEPIWKRAPAAGFFGMRGKKVPSSTFYGMRGKKGPSGFLGMRGKKSDDGTSPKLVLSNGDTSIDDLMSFGGAGIGLKMKGAGMGGKSGNLLDTYDDYSLFGVTGPSASHISSLNRAPVEGLRGKRYAGAYSSPGNPLHSYQ